MIIKDFLFIQTSARNCDVFTWKMIKKIFKENNKKVEMTKREK